MDVPCDYHDVYLSLSDAPWWDTDNEIMDP